MKPSNANIFRVTGPLWGEFTGDRSIPLTKVSAESVRSFGVSFDLRLKEGWVNSRDAVDLRRHRAHCGVTVMVIYTLYKVVPLARHNS